MFFYFKRYVIYLGFCFAILTTSFLGATETSYPLWDSTIKIDFDDDDVIILEEGDGYIIVVIEGNTYYFKK